MTALEPSRRGTDFQRILIVRLSSMGDVLHALPAAVMLREAFPQATLGWVIEERWAELLCALSTPRSGARSPQRPLVDVIHPVSLKKWRSSIVSNHTWERIAASLSDLRALRYEVAVDLQGAVRSAILARWSGAPVVAGATQPRENLASLWYSRKVITQRPHVIEQYAELAETVIGHPLPIPDAVLPCDPIAEEAVEKRLRAMNIRGFAVLNPGAGWGAKQWPAERYGHVAQALSRQGIQPVINFGPREEELAKVAEAASGGAARVMSFSVGELVALMRRARLFIGGDTGPMHLAAALHIPVVALFGPTDPGRNGPFRTKSIVLRNPSSSTTLTHRAEPDKGLLALSAGEVVAAGMRLLENPRA
ncbi:MAG: glycosyltransferase family 9 protein [Terriglobales bacterium]